VPLRHGEMKFCDLRNAAKPFFTAEVGLDTWIPLFTSRYYFALKTHPVDDSQYVMAHPVDDSQYVMTASMWR
jgi:hypothetical protein